MSDETTSTQQYTEAEEAFIAASIDVLNAAVVLDEAERNYQAAEQAVIPLADQLDLPENRREAIDRTNVLTHEAAARAGYGPDSPVVEGLDRTYQSVLAFLDAVDQAAAEAITNGTNPQF